MSIESYKRNAKRRVTSPSTPTCLPAALEQVSPDHGYRPNVYRQYREFDAWYGSHSVRQRNDLIGDFEEEITQLVRPLGGLACEDLVFSKATTIIGFLRVVRPLLREGYRVTMDLTYACSGAHNAHCVGLLPVGEETDFVTLVSNHVPKSLVGIVNLRLLASSLSISEDRHMVDHPLNDANILALPPID